MLPSKKTEYRETKKRGHWLRKGQPNTRGLGRGKQRVHRGGRKTSASRSFIWWFQGGGENLNVYKKKNGGDNG